MQTIVGSIRSDLTGSYLVTDLNSPLESIRLQGALLFSLTGDRGCPGYYRLDPSLIFAHVACPTTQLLGGGRTRCAGCEESDDSKLLHNAHRLRSVSKLVTAYLMQPHWLYVAAFADGAVKVGTAAQSRKFARVLEQGACAVEFIGMFPDGLSVRRAEEQVTRLTGLGQSISGTRKIKGLLEPLPRERIRHACLRGAELARNSSEVLKQSDTRESWEPPRNELLEPRTRLRLPVKSMEPKETVEWDVQATLGRIGLIRDSGSAALVDYVFDFGALIGQRIETAPLVVPRDSPTLF